MATFKTKRRGLGLDVKTIQGEKNTYIFFRTKSGSYHVFTEVEAKEAARDCGAKKESDAQTMCKDVWKESS